MTNTDIISSFTPHFLDIQGVVQLQQAIQLSNLLIYGEIHGVKENADVIYTLVRELNIQRIAIENSPSVKGFIDAASRGVYDFSRIDSDTFDSSVLSLEVAKALAVLLEEGVVDEIVYVDTFFDDLEPPMLDHPDSPQKREQILAENILRLDIATPTLCLMGQWHTQPEPVQLDDIVHNSALYRIRQAKQSVPFVHVIYRERHVYNDGQTLELPTKQNLPKHYKISQSSALDFELCVPYAHPIVLM